MIAAQLREAQCFGHIPETAAEQACFSSKNSSSHCCWLWSLPTEVCTTRAKPGHCLTKLQAGSKLSLQQNRRSLEFLFPSLCIHSLLYFHSFRCLSSKKWLKWQAAISKQNSGPVSHSAVFLCCLQCLLPLPLPLCVQPFSSLILPLPFPCRLPDGKLPPKKHYRGSVNILKLPSPSEELTSLQAKNPRKENERFTWL